MGQRNGEQGGGLIGWIRPICLAAFSSYLLSACVTHVPGAHYPKTRSTALADARSTVLGKQFMRASAAHEGKSAFRLLTVGVDGFLARIEMINAAERTLDLQYYIFRGDESGRLITQALVRAADRGVRVRVLVDDGETVPGDEQLLALANHAAIEIRVFNPFAYRGHSKALRAVEFLAGHSRLDYRMHNKMLIVDNALGLVGGRNIGDQYFQIDPQSQFADDDLFVGGAVIREMSAKFDDFWNSPLAIPAQALARRAPTAVTVADYRNGTAAHAEKVKTAGFNYRDKLAADEPLAGMLDGELPLVWANAQVVADSPEKKRVVAGVRSGTLMYEPVAEAVGAVQTELLMVTPYFIPTQEEVRLLQADLARGVQIRIITNSLESAPDLSAHAGYMHYRESLLQQGVEFHEVRSLLGDTRGSGESAKLARYGNYALHAKLFVMDRQKVFVGSMNFDQRSRRLNTEIGLIIESPDLSQQTAARFEAMAKEENSYAVILRTHADRNAGRLVWRTVEEGKVTEYTTEPSRGLWQKFKVRALSLLPLDREL